MIFRVLLQYFFGHVIVWLCNRKAYIEIALLKVLVPGLRKLYLTDALGVRHVDVF